MSANNSNPSFQCRLQTARIVQIVLESRQAMFDSRMNQKRHLPRSQPFIKRVASRIVQRDILCGGYPLEQTGAHLSHPIQFIQGIPAVWMNAGAKEQLVMLRGIVHHIIVADNNSCVIPAKSAIPLIHSIQSQ
ncbi:MAG: hypothetical protein A2X46_06505 [Lentisphaerae bacterium GWF2_57_35]|nr:MAG: hypothetical protein A2X46_06505 [Lentisphaerae bacterium GWF2_57_35]